MDGPRLVLCLVGSQLLFCCSCDQSKGPDRGAMRNRSRVQTIVNGKIKLIIDGKDQKEDVVVGSGTAKSQTRQLDSFTHVETQFGVGIKVIRGEPSSVTIKCDDNILPIVLTDVRDGKLIIDASQSLLSTMPIHLLVTTPELKSASTEGSGHFFLDNVTNDSLKLDINGSGEIGGQGKVKSIKASINGSGKLLLEKVIAQDVSITISGSGNAKVQAIDFLDASISGSGNIRYVGEPRKINRSISGSGNIQSVAK